jgi:hypothetical protein
MIWFPILTSCCGHRTSSLDRMPPDILQLNKGLKKNGTNLREKIFLNISTWHVFFILVKLNLPKIMERSNKKNILGLCMEWIFTFSLLKSVLSCKFSNIAAPSSLVFIMLSTIGLLAKEHFNVDSRSFKKSKDWSPNSRCWTGESSLSFVYFTGIDRSRQERLFTWLTE